MGYYDELDDEIDREMGWKSGDRKINSPRRRPDYWQALLRTAKASTSPFWRTFSSVARAVGKVAFFPIISPMGYTRRFNAQGDMIVVKKTIVWRIIDGLFMRILLTPVILALFLIAIVYASTHPQRVQASSTPDSFGTYYKRVNLMTVDHQGLTGWFIPPINADEVAFDPMGTLAQKWPAVVLCHGLGASHDQYMPLAQELHTAGFAVLLLDMRGQGESDGGAVTYGLRERMDVLAGVKFLRETDYIDETKVCVVGHDIGATAALQAAALDSSITAVVADGLWLNFEDRAREIFSRPPANAGAWAARGGRMPTQWLAPLYTMTFEIAVRDRLEQLNPETVVRSLHKPVLFVVRSGQEFAPLQDVLTLATLAGGEHDAFLDDAKVLGDSEARIREFLMKAAKWKGPNSKGRDEIEQLMKNRVTK
jgi:pimeloyl-ACP methyl ester carboxylesterase